MSQVGRGSGVMGRGVMRGRVSDGSMGCNNSLVDSRRSFYDSVESVVGVSSVLDSAHGTVRLNEGVRSLNDVSFTGFLLVFGVSGVGVGHGITKGVVRNGIRVDGLSDGFHGRSVGQRSMSVGGGGIAEGSQTSTSGGGEGKYANNLEIDKYNYVLADSRKIAICANRVFSISSDLHREYCCRQLITKVFNYIFI